MAVTKLSVAVCLVAIAAAPLAHAAGAAAATASFNDIMTGKNWLHEHSCVACSLQPAVLCITERLDD